MTTDESKAEAIINITFTSNENSKLQNPIQGAQKKFFRSFQSRNQLDPPFQGLKM